MERVRLGSAWVPQFDLVEHEEIRSLEKIVDPTFPFIYFSKSNYVTRLPIVHCWIEKGSREILIGEWEDVGRWCGGISFVMGNKVQPSALKTFPYIHNSV